MDTLNLPEHAESVLPTKSRDNVAKILIQVEWLVITQA